MEAEAALRRMVDLLRRGGTLAVLGLARSRYPGDLPRDLAAAIVNLAYRFAWDHWESPAPTVWPPPHTYREIQSSRAHTSAGTLPPPPALALLDRLDEPAE